MLPLLVLVGLLGLAVGSFVNVVVYRVPRGESLLRPSSHCPLCGTPVRPLHNMPVLGWLLLRGRCAHCRQRFGGRYPLVEIGTAVLFMVVTIRIGGTPALPAYLFLAAVAVALAVIDLDVRRLPNAIVLPSYLVAAVLLVPAAVAEPDAGRVLRALAAMALLWTFYFGLALLYRGGMGFGDVKLAGLLGLYLGWLGWPAVWIGTLAGFLLGGLVGGALVVTRRAGRKTAIPFGPAMLAGAMLAVLLADPIATWYGLPLTA